MMNVVPINPPSLAVGSISLQVTLRVVLLHNLSVNDYSTATKGTKENADVSFRQSFNRCAQPKP